MAKKHVTAKKTAKVHRKKATQPLRLKRANVSRSYTQQIKHWLITVGTKVVARTKLFLKRRPHRSFRLTKRRDYSRSLALPGYIVFTNYVTKSLLRHKKTFIALVVLYAVTMLALGGITSQENYSQISTLLRDSKEDVFDGQFGGVGQAGLLLLSAFASGPGNLSPDQQIYIGFTLLFVWLCTVWLHREYLLGRKPKLRDGLYNSGAPFLSTLALVSILIIQLLPIGIIALVYSGLSSARILDGGFAAMLFWLVAVLVAALVLYWVTSTVIAMVIVTLPGMYPIKAMRLAGDVVVGRRLRVLYRILWGVLLMCLLWAVVLIPLVLLDTALGGTWQQFKAVPLMPVAVACMSAYSTVWLASYVYLLYRKVVEDDASPA
ncbi:MAG: hypothetical protein WAQ25_04200 [Candidatus Saccharimonas sp.]